MKLIAMIGAALLLALPLPNAAQQPTYQIVVNASNPVAALSKDEVSRIFLKRQADWKHGGTIAPVDLNADSKVRAQFTRSIHGRTVAAIGSYWQQQIFSGNEVPPAEKSTDQEVLEFVRKNPNAIGYVSTAIDLGNGVKAVVTR